MAKTTILVRCVAPNVRTLEQIADLTSAFPEFSVVAVPDLVNVPTVEHRARLAEFPGSALGITNEFLSDSGLHLAGNRTGWICGDYVLYRALEFDWDYAWIIEPDVYFLNGSQALLALLEESVVDLMTTHYWRTSPGWVWHEPLASLRPELDVHAMAFPLSRLSRVLTQQCLDLRTSLTPLLSDGIKVPNDESVVATAANLNGATVKDLRRALPSVFSYWNTILKYPVRDIESRERTPLIIHSGLEPDAFKSYLLSMWHALGDGWDPAHGKLSSALEQAGPETLRQFVEELMLERADAATG